ncbi:hypothetical protein KAU40_01500 [Candidatus Parcubacteria bacterium]|nr:hypothetical protein [Candidatus Parcubacteria bacterium]
MKEKFLFRFLGKMPRGKFEFSCVCGEQNFGLRIPADTKQDARLEFTCKKCGAKITVWEQPEHWHMVIVLSVEEVKI